jgi:hypothetical protein
MQTPEVSKNVAARQSKQNDICGSWQLEEASCPLSFFCKVDLPEGQILGLEKSEPININGDVDRRQRT